MKVIYYYHIPKCGGTFIIENFINLSYQLNNSSLYRFSNWEKAEKYNDPTATSIERENIKDFLKELPTLEYDYVLIHHHHKQCGLKELLPLLIECSDELKANGNELYMFTVVRELIPFATSYVNYSNETKLMIDGYPASFDKLPFGGNIQSNYLLYNTNFYQNSLQLPAADKSSIKEILGFINKVYTTNNLKEVESDLRKLINKDIIWSNEKVKESKKTILPTEEQKTLLLKENNIDAWLYNYIKGGDGE